MGVTTRSTLDGINWSAVNRATRRQVRNREVYCPPISLFRWWARRPHALTRALLDASNLEPEDLVSDPFSGGGTVTLESAAKGHRVYAQDLNPWAVWGLRTALDGVSPTLLRAGIDSFWQKLRNSTSRYYATNCPTHGNGEILHTFWVRECTCPHCAQALYLYPYSLITLAGRKRNEKIAFYGCSACGRVTQRGTARRVACEDCGHELAGMREPLLVQKRVWCPHCSQEVSYRDAWSRKPKWKPVLVQRFCSYRDKQIVHFDEPTPTEVARALTCVNTPAPLLEKIPMGRETAVLRRGGFRKWSDLYPSRQLKVLLKGVKLANDPELDRHVRSRIQLAIAGAGEMAGHLCRWDRFHPKAFEALANHRFAVLGLAVETNLVAERGRGTLKLRLRNSLSAANWAQTHISEPNSRARQRVAPVEEPGGKARQCTIVAGTSSKQRIPTNSVRLVITDPPYYDAVQYGELSGLFIAWARAVTGRRRPWTVDLRFEAVPNETRKAGAKHYESLLRSIFKETARTMRDDGKLLLTYHGMDFRGWAALGRALHWAGLRVEALAVAHSENEKDHPKRNRNAFSKDLVIECGKNTSAYRAPVVVNASRRPEQRELLAAGVTIANHSGKEYAEMAQKFQQLTKRMRRRRIRVPTLF